MTEPFVYDGRCLICGGRGAFPSSVLAWVPWTRCDRCDGSGHEPSAAIREALEGFDMDQAAS